MTKEILKSEIRKYEKKIVDCHIAIGHLKPGVKSVHVNMDLMDHYKTKRAELVLKLSKLK